MSFREYVEHGWALCFIKDGEKRPTLSGWNELRNAITDPTRAQHLVNAGLLHAFSGTCAIDVDNMDLACAWLSERGIDLRALFKADDAVQIVSGDAARGKLIYRLPVQPDETAQQHARTWATKQIKNDDKSLMLFELRCGASTGNSAQDVLPPSTNPRTGKRYEWKYNSDLVGDWRNLPELPAELAELWQSLLRHDAHDSPVAITSDLAELRELIATRDPDASYDEWCKVGMIIHHETAGSDEGLALWDEWSQRGTKYKGFDDLELHWPSFGNAPMPATAGALRREVVAKRDDFDLVPTTIAAQPGDVDLGAIDNEMAAKREAELLARFKWSTLVELMNRAPNKWLIDDVLPQEELVMLFGQSGAGKSFVALDMALAIARGVPWRGFDTQQGTVCWLAAEAEGSMRNRGRAYAEANDLDPAAIENFYVLGSNINLADSELVRALARSSRSLQPVLVVVDTLAAASGGANENSGEDMGRVLDNCRAIFHETGATVLLVHHSGKNEELGARGWSGIKAAVTAELSVAKRENSDLRDIVITKLRDGTQEGVVMPFSLQQVSIGLDHRERMITSAVVKHEEYSEPAKRKTAPKAPTLSSRAESLLDQLCPIDGDPIIPIDAFLDVYADSLIPPPPGAKDNRWKDAYKQLNDLAKRDLVFVDKKAGTVTRIKTVAAESPDNNEDLI